MSLITARSPNFRTRSVTSITGASGEGDMTKNDEIRMTKSEGNPSSNHQAITKVFSSFRFDHYFGLRHSGFGLSYLFLQILEKIRFSSLASVQSFRASGLSFGTARTIIRRKCFVSRASFRHVPMFLRNSFFDT